jgi:hypothetical protein
MTTGKFHWIENMFTQQVLGLATESIEPTKLILITQALSTVTENPWWPHLLFVVAVSYQHDTAGSGVNRDKLSLGVN